MKREFLTVPSKHLGIISSFLNLNACLLFIFDFPIATSWRLRNRVICVSGEETYIYIFCFSWFKEALERLDEISLKSLPYNHENLPLESDSFRNTSFLGWRYIKLLSIKNTYTKPHRIITKHRLLCQMELGLNLALALISCEILGKLFTFSESQFLHL